MDSKRPGHYEKAHRLLEVNYAVSRELGDERIVAASLIHNKIGSHSRAEAARFASENGLL